MAAEICRQTAIKLKYSRKAAIAAFLAIFATNFITTIS